MDNIKKHIGLIFELGKMRITFFVAFSTSVGFVLHSAKLNWITLLISLGVFILACGCSALNHYQERNFDSKMDRTKGRPIPSGRISANYALTFSVVMIVLGLVLIYLSSNFNAVLLGVIALIWYNFIYTPLKRKYALAVIPGSLIGAIPPVIGWVSSGGNIFDMKILTVAFFFFIWQIPHFWLLLMLHSKDYEKAGFPTLTKIFSSLQLGRITFAWIAALTTSCMLIPFYDYTTNIYAIIIMLLLGIWLLWQTRAMLSDYLENIIFRKIFLRVNFYVLAVVIILSIDKLILRDILL